MCHRKGAATAAARLSFLSPSSVAIPVLGYPNFTPESQYLLITLEGIVLYSLWSLPPPIPLRIFLSLPHAILPTRSCYAFSPTDLAPSSFGTFFREKKKKQTVLPSRCQGSQLFFAIPVLRALREKEFVSVERETRELWVVLDENSPHDSLFLEGRLPCRWRMPQDWVEFEEIRRARP